MALIAQLASIFLESEKVHLYVAKECLSYEDTCMAVRVSILAKGRTISYIHGLCAWSETDTCSTLCSSRRRDDPTIMSCKVSIKNKNF